MPWVAVGFVPPLVLGAVVIAVLADTFPHGRFVVPSVDAPRDVSAVAADPCTALPSVTYVRLGYLPSGGSGPHSARGEPSCIRLASTAEFGAMTLWVSRGTDEFGRLYRRSPAAVSDLQWFDDLPGLVEQRTPNAGSCSVTVAVAPGDTLSVDVSTDTAPCDRARAVAQAVVDRLPRR